jgi:hypothetical protein
MRALYAVCLATALALCGCGNQSVHTVCTGGVNGAVATGAALFELDDYGTADHCQGPDVYDGSVAPLSRRSFPPGAGISLQLTPGRHTLVLRAFSDSGGSKPIGSGCVELQLDAGANVCIDLSLTASADDGGAGAGGGGGGGGGGGPPDFAGCTVGTVANCGGCGVSCDTVHSLGASCSAAACSFSGCAANWVDCTPAPPNYDGCECQGTGCCNGACQTKHSDGLGDAFYDCVALGTQDATQVQKAAAAWDASGSIDAAPRTYSDSKGSINYICDQSTKRNACACWTWNGTGQYAGVGHALATNRKATQCFIPFASTYPVWN